MRSYKRKTNRQDWNSDDMERAIIAVKSGQSIRSVVREYNIPKTTLRRRLCNKNKRVHGNEKGLGRFTTVFTPEMEEDLVQYVLLMEERLFGLTPQDIRQLAFQVVQKNNVMG